MTAKPRFLVCVECGEEFVFTAKAQDYFAEKGYTEDPKRCKHCHMLYKREKKINGGFEPENSPIDQLRTDF